MTDTDLRAVIALLEIDLAALEVKLAKAAAQADEATDIIQEQNQALENARAEGWREALARVMVEAEGSEGDFDFLAWRMRELLKEGPPNE